MISHRSHPCAMCMCTEQIHLIINLILTPPWYSPMVDQHQHSGVSENKKIEILSYYKSYWIAISCSLIGYFGLLTTSLTSIIITTISIIVMSSDLRDDLVGWCLLPSCLATRDWKWDFDENGAQCWWDWGFGWWEYYCRGWVYLKRI